MMSATFSVAHGTQGLFRTDCSVEAHNVTVKEASPCRRRRPSHRELAVVAPSGTGVTAVEARRGGVPVVEAVERDPHPSRAQKGSSCRRVPLNSKPTLAVDRRDFSVSNPIVYVELVTMTSCRVRLAARAAVSTGASRSTGPAMSAMTPSPRVNRSNPPGGSASSSGRQRMHAVSGLQVAKVSAAVRTSCSDCAQRVVGPGRTDLVKSARSMCRRRCRMARL